MDSRVIPGDAYDLSLDTLRAVSSIFWLLGEFADDQGSVHALSSMGADLTTRISAELSKSSHTSQTRP